VAIWKNDDGSGAKAELRRVKHVNGHEFELEAIPNSLLEK
jgi:hypothetical protein